MLAFVSTFAVASVALAATGDKGAPKASLVKAVSSTNRVPTLRYMIDISISRAHSPAMRLHVEGTRDNDALFIHVRQMSSVTSDGTAMPQESELIDGPFLYEGSPNGVPVLGHILWMRVPLARIGARAKVVSTVHNLSPAPLLRLLDEWSQARTHSPNGFFHGTVAYDDPIVLTALSVMTGGVQFRDLWFSARIGDDGYVHSILITGRTADGSRMLRVVALLYGFGRPVRLTPPGEGTFMDPKAQALAE
ncbi:MAG TPA: hypothetical protein VIY73_23470 [Polyangiaceae bacterium]